MAYDTLNELLTGIANAIRTVEESTGTINAQDFPDRIRSILNENGLTLTYNFSNGEPSDGSGNIYLIATSDSYLDTYDICWSNSSGVMSNYSPINTLELSTTSLNEQIVYDKFISLNAIPKYATGICAVSKTDGEVKAICNFPSYKLWSDDKFGEHLYSFGAISDIHMRFAWNGTEEQYLSSEANFDPNRDLSIALNYFNNNENVVCTCVSGDLINDGTPEQMEAYISCKNTYSPSTPVYECNGNHECWYASKGSITDVWATLRDEGMWYYKEINGDIFVFLNIHSSSHDGTMWTDEELDWLNNILETYRNQRVFLFTHLFPVNGTGFANTRGIYDSTLWGADYHEDRKRLVNLMKHYKNVIWFSGHTHEKYYLQEDNANQNYIRLNGDGARCLHLSSISQPRDLVTAVDEDGNISYGISGKLTAQSEGAVVDVYENHIIFRARNFVDGKFISIAQYILDTTPVTIQPDETLGTNYSITNNLAYTSNSNVATTIKENESYSATLSASIGYSLGDVTVTMGGTDITSTSYSDGIITISSVTGDIVINATSNALDTTVSCTGISLDKSTINLTSIGETSTITATVEPSNTTDEVTWGSDNTSVATVNNGVVTCVENGSATITATCGTKTVTCSVVCVIGSSTDSSVVYQLSESKHFDNTADVIDTNVSPFKKDESWTVFCEFTFENATAAPSSGSTSNTTIAETLFTSSDSDGYSVIAGKTNSSANMYLKGVQTSTDGSGSVLAIKSNVKTANSRNAIIISHNAGEEYIMYGAKSYSTNTMSETELSQSRFVKADFDINDTIKIGGNGNDEYFYGDVTRFIITNDAKNASYFGFAESSTRATS